MISKQTDSSEGKIGRNFILRIWSDAPTNESSWVQLRISLQDTETSLRRGFSSVDDFTNFIEAICNELLARK